jgi:hypothetical protein
MSTSRTFKKAPKAKGEGRSRKSYSESDPEQEN